MTIHDKQFAALNETAGASKELLAFFVGGQEFCIDVVSIREIRGWTLATQLPQTPHYVCGVINLRGTVLPIVDLAARLGYPAAHPTARHAIIVANIANQTVGLLVEGVSEIFSITDDQVQPVPEIASDAATNFVLGMIPLNARLISLISPLNLLPDLRECV